MASVRITESELARDVHAVLAKVQAGVEVIAGQFRVTRFMATIRLSPVFLCFAASDTGGSR